MRIPDPQDLQRIADQMHRPHEDMYNEWFYGYFNLSKEQKAQEKLADSEIYQKHCLAKKYGIQIYNMFGANK